MGPSIELPDFKPPDRQFLRGSAKYIMTQAPKLSQFVPWIAILLLTVSCNRPQVATTGSQDLQHHEDAPPKFEYLVAYMEYGKDADRLNDLGRKGWELVAVHPLEQGAKAHPFYFKRKIHTAGQATPSAGDKPPI